MESECNTRPNVPVSIGELVDKYTILHIKRQHVKTPEHIVMVEKELAYLRPIAERYNSAPELVEELLVINRKLWEIEDKLRQKERLQLFDDDFIQLARSVYIMNDRRADTKLKINIKESSILVEVKTYAPYRD